MAYMDEPSGTRGHEHPRVVAPASTAEPQCVAEALEGGLHPGLAAHVDRADRVRPGGHHELKFTCIVAGLPPNLADRVEAKDVAVDAKQAPLFINNDDVVADPT